MRLHSRICSVTCDPVAVRQHEVDDRRVGRLDRHGVDRLGGGRGGHHVEAGVAEHHLHRAQDLRLVVADEHPPPVAHARGRLAGLRPAAAARARRSCPAPAATPPTAGRRWPPRSRGRSPARGPSPPSRAALGAVEGLEDPLELLGGDARALVGDPHAQVVAQAPRLDGHRARRARGGARSRAGSRARARAAPESAWTSGRSGSISTAPPARPAGSEASADSITSSTEHQSSARAAARSPAGRGRAGRRPAGRGAPTRMRITAASSSEPGPPSPPRR